MIRRIFAGVLAAAAIGTGGALASSRTTAVPIGSGVVVIETELGYQAAAAAGTGMVLTSRGEVLTNNHVIAGATTIKVEIPRASRVYTATVVGYDAADDVAVLQLKNASNLKTVTIGSSAKLRLGARVTAIGNAGGTGVLTSSAGSVTGLRMSIQVQDDSGGVESLSGLIETDAGLQPGDSGGPLVDPAGAVVGMDTAGAAASPFAAYAASDGYAIPIAKASSVAKQILAGQASARVHIGGTAFLGVSVGQTYAGGATVVATVSGGPADAAGLVAGDVITAVGGKPVSSAADIAPIMLTAKPGAKVVVSFVGLSGLSGTATVTLGSGPAQ